MRSGFHQAVVSVSVVCLVLLGGCGAMSGSKSSGGGATAALCPARHDRLT